jgi:hypothetical protein
MLKEANVLYSDLGDQHKAKFSSWAKGQPEGVRPFLLDRFNESRRQYFPGEMSGSMNQPQGAQQTPAKIKTKAEVNSYAQQHNLNPDQAAKLLTGRGYVIK